jgi:Na+/melibiose symporter-like transporter
MLPLPGRSAMLGTTAMIPNESSPTFRRMDYVKITIFGFAMTALWQSLHTIILPVRLLDFVAESQKNTYLGLLTLSGLLLAMAVQPVVGALSDRSGFKWGRRRPYILLGSLAAVLFIPGVGWAGSYAAIFTFYCLLQISTNTAQGPYQAFIPDLVPEGKRGLASGVKGLLETLGGAALIYFSGLIMGRYSADAGGPWLWLVLGILAIIMLGAMITTVVSVKEPPVTGHKRRTSFLSTLYQTGKEIKANHDLTWFLVSRLLFFMAFTTIQQFALYFLRDVIGVKNPAEATAQFTILAIAAMLVVVWPAGYLSDRTGRKPITIAAGLLGALGIAIIFGSQDYGTILWAATIIGIAMGIFNSTNWALATDLVAKGEEARYLAIANVATAGGAALARLVGIGIDFFNGYSPGLGYQFMLAVCFVYFIAAAALVAVIKKRR